MNLKKFIMEIGMGMDQHGQDPTHAARKAVKDAVSRSCLTGLLEIARLDDVNDMVVDVLVACPHADRVNAQAVLDALPFGQKQIEVVEGGMVARAIYQPELGDVSDEAYVATAAVTVWVDVDHVRRAWTEEGGQGRHS
ncbi:MAG TPA: Lin0512 family protein [Anaerolineae bacterium]|nr:Lin0512 family protein [Anaerolineae bacterium]